MHHKHLTRNGRKSYTPEQKEAAAAARASGEKKSKKASTRVGPYSITLLKNPITDFELGGVKVLPAAIGIGGAIALSQVVRNLSFVSSMTAGPMRDAIPGAVVAALGAAGMYYCKKSKNTGILKDLSEDLTGFGMFVGLNDVLGSQITTMVDKLKSSVAAPATTTAATTTAATPAAALKGGAFLNGGGWNTPQLNGYHVTKNGAGYPPAFSLNGGKGYMVDQGLSLNGYHMAGDAGSAATMAAITSLNGGAFRDQTIGGIDMNGFQD